MTTVLDALQNAHYNFQTIGRMGVGSNPIYRIAMDQLANAINALECGKTPDDLLQEKIDDDAN